MAQTNGDDKSTITAQYEGTVLEVIARAGFPLPPEYDVKVEVIPVSFEGTPCLNTIPLGEMPGRRAYKGMKFGLEITVNNLTGGVEDLFPKSVEHKITTPAPRPKRVYSGVVYKVEGGKVYAYALHDRILNQPADIDFAFDEANVSGEYAAYPEYEGEESEAIPHEHFIEMLEDGTVLIRPTFWQGQDLVTKLANDLVCRNNFGQP